MGRGFFQLQAGGFPLPVSGLDLLERRLVCLETWALDSPGPAQAPAQCVSRKTTQGGQFLLGHELNPALWGEGTPQAASPWRS